MMWVVVIFMFLVMLPLILPDETKRYWVKKLADLYFRLQRWNDDLDKQIVKDEEKIKSLLNK